MRPCGKWNGRTCVHVCVCVCVRCRRAAGRRTGTMNCGRTGPVRVVPVLRSAHAVRVFARAVRQGMRGVSAASVDWFYKPKRPYIFNKSACGSFGKLPMAKLGRSDVPWLSGAGAQ